MTEGFNQVSPSTADLFRLAPLKTGAIGGIGPPADSKADFKKVKGYGRILSRWRILSGLTGCSWLLTFVGRHRLELPRDTIAADKRLSCFGVSRGPRRSCRPRPIRSVLIGGCVALWRIGLRVSDARCGRCFLPWVPPPGRRFSMQPGALVFLEECIQCRMVIQCRAEGADEIHSIVVTSRPLAKELETKVQLFWGHAW